MHPYLYTSILTLLLALPLPQAAAQPDPLSREQVSQERRAAMSRYETAQRILAQASEQSQVSADELIALQRQTDLLRASISLTEQELFLLSTELEDTQEIIRSLRSDLAGLKKEYAAMLYLSSKDSNPYLRLSFLLASESVRQLMARYHFLKYYQQARREQISEIVQVSQRLERRIQDLQKQQVEKEMLMQQEQQQVAELAQLISRQNQLLAQLKGKEGALRAQLARQGRELAQLGHTIEEVVKDAAASVAVSTEGVAEKENKLSLTTRFATQMGLLRWPVEQGFIIQKFGRQPHPAMNGLWTDNLGVDIRTLPDQEAIAVFDGVVAAVTQAPGLGQLVMLQHGDFFSVYGRLDQVAIRPGQMLRAGDRVGRVATNEQGHPELQFQIWKKQQKLDPEKWLTK